MLGISRQTDYAARLVLHLACLGPDALEPIARIAAQRQLPASFVRRLVGRLVRAGIVACTRGPAGGVRLARPPALISLLDVVRASEGEPVLNSCLADPGTHPGRGRGCPLAGGCPVQVAWDGASRALAASLDGVRFDALAAIPGHRHAHGSAPGGGRAASPATPVAAAVQPA